MQNVGWPASDASAHHRRMHNRSLAYARYWRHSLADAELARGVFSESDQDVFLPLRRGALPVGHVSPDVVARCFEGEPAEESVVAVVLRPWVFARVLVHGQRVRNGRPEFITPVVTPALLYRDGRLAPQDGTVIARDLLEPLERDSLALGNVAALDRYLSLGGVPPANSVGPDGRPVGDDAFAAAWQAHVASRDGLFGAVCGGWHGDDEYVLADHGWLLKKKPVQGAARHLLHLYDHLLAQEPDVPLFDRFAAEPGEVPEPCLPRNAGFKERLAHSTPDYPLAAGQRQALAHLLAGRDAEILAINGPPGTGKTTLVLAVVATLWAKAALARGEPPVVLAASTNNQAVTNVLDAFGKEFAAGSGPLAGRWLPDVRSFGAYFASGAKSRSHGVNYQTRAFFDALESAPYVVLAEAHYVDAAAAWCGDAPKDVGEIVAALHRQLELEARKLSAIEDAWQAWSGAQHTLRAALGDHPAGALDALRRDALARRASREAHERFAARWDTFQAKEPMLLALFGWLPAVARRRAQRARSFLRAKAPAGFDVAPLARLAHMDAQIAAVSRDAVAASHSADDALRQAEALEMATRRAERDWLAAIACLGLAAGPRSPTLAEADERADMVVRFEIFRLATHYWEGRWLLEMQQLLPDLASLKRKTGARAVQARWQRQMKLTPCVVSTLHMLPSFMKVVRADGNQFVEDYLHGGIDLLIVDEAGQVLPEVAGASFALARRALVIGDTQQLEPIWSVPWRVDAGNLVSCGLWSADDDRGQADRLDNLGKTASSGSVMRIAQCASRWQSDPELARGLWLQEHRRCVDEVIAYSNQLCYHGKLLPCRGPKGQCGVQDGLPAMGYLHVDGLCEQASGGSRVNRMEARALAAWLAQHRTALEAAYGKPLHEIVGIVTPFAPQVRAIVQACGDAGIAAGRQSGEVTVGTVHALQGAERQVVLFSGVYSKHADGGFIDRTTSMLNVAVSRAKNTFLVFGDMDVFQLAGAGTPRAQLAAMLFADDANALAFEAGMREDLVAGDVTVRQLRDAPAHDGFLLQLLAQARREVHVVTPWLRPGCAESTGLLGAIAAAVARGVEVHVYADIVSNTAHRDPAAVRRREQAFGRELRVLAAAGAHPVVVRKVHSKIVIGDDDVYCVGSFNWLSAVREPAGARHETSLVYEGWGLSGEIDAMKRSLSARTVAWLGEDALAGAVRAMGRVEHASAAD